MGSVTSSEDNQEEEDLPRGTASFNFLDAAFRLLPSLHAESEDDKPEAFTAETIDSSVVKMNPEAVGFLQAQLSQKSGAQRETVSDGCRDEQAKDKWMSMKKDDCDDEDGEDDVCEEDEDEDEEEDEECEDEDGEDEEDEGKGNGDSSRCGVVVAPCQPRKEKDEGKKEETNNQRRAICGVTVTPCPPRKDPCGDNEKEDDCEDDEDDDDDDDDDDEDEDCDCEDDEDEEEDDDCDEDDDDDDDDEDDDEDDCEEDETEICDEDYREEEDMWECEEVVNKATQKYRNQLKEDGVLVGVQEMERISNTYKSYGGGNLCLFQDEDDDDDKQKVGEDDDDDDDDDTYYKCGGREAPCRGVCEEEDEESDSEEDAFYQGLKKESDDVLYNTYPPNRRPCLEDQSQVNKQPATVVVKTKNYWVDGMTIKNREEPEVAAQPKPVPVPKKEVQEEEEEEQYSFFSKKEELEQAMLENEKRQCDNEKNDVVGQEYCEGELVYRDSEVVTAPPEVMDVIPREDTNTEPYYHTWQDNWSPKLDEAERGTKEILHGIIEERRKIDDREYENEQPNQQFNPVPLPESLEKYYKPLSPIPSPKLAEKVVVKGTSPDNNSGEGERTDGLTLPYVKPLTMPDSKEKRYKPTRNASSPRTDEKKVVVKETSPPGNSGERGRTDGRTRNRKLVGPETKPMAVQDPKEKLNNSRRNVSSPRTDEMKVVVKEYGRTRNRNLTGPETKRDEKKKPNNSRTNATSPKVTAEKNGTTKETRSGNTTGRRTDGMVHTLKATKPESKPQQIHDRKKNSQSPATRGMAKDEDADKTPTQSPKGKRDLPKATTGGHGNRVKSSDENASLANIESQNTPPKPNLASYIDKLKEMKIVYKEVKPVAKQPKHKSPAKSPSPNRPRGKATLKPSNDPARQLLKPNLPKEGVSVNKTNLLDGQTSREDERHSIPKNPSQRNMLDKVIDRSEKPQIPIPIIGRSEKPQIPVPNKRTTSTKDPEKRLIENNKKKSEGTAVRRKDCGLDIYSLIATSANANDRSTVVQIIKPLESSPTEDTCTEGDVPSPKEDTADVLPSDTEREGLDVRPSDDYTGQTFDDHPPNTDKETFDVPQSDNYTGKNFDGLPSDKNTGTQFDVHPPSKDMETFDVSQSNEDPGTTFDGIPPDKDTGTFDDLPGDKDIGTTFDGLPSDKDTGTFDDLPGDKDIGTTFDVHPPSKDKETFDTLQTNKIVGTTQDVLASNKDKRIALSVLPPHDYTRTKEDVLPSSKDTAKNDTETASEVPHSKRRTVCGRSSNRDKREKIADLTHAETIQEALQLHKDKMAALDDLPQDEYAEKVEDVLQSKKDKRAPFGARTSNKDKGTRFGVRVSPSKRDVTPTLDVRPPTPSDYPGTTEDAPSPNKGTGGGPMGDIPSKKDPGTTINVLPSNRDVTGTTINVLPSNKDSGATITIVPSNKDTGATINVLPSNNDTGATINVLQSKNDTGATINVLPSGQDTGAKTDFLPSSREVANDDSETTMESPLSTDEAARPMYPPTDDRIKGRHIYMSNADTAKTRGVPLSQNAIDQTYIGNGAVTPVPCTGNVGCVHPLDLDIVDPEDDDLPYDHATLLNDDSARIVNIPLPNKNTDKPVNISSFNEYDTRKEARDISWSKENSSKIEMIVNNPFNDVTAVPVQANTTLSKDNGSAEIENWAPLSYRNNAKYCTAAESEDVNVTRPNDSPRATKVPLANQEDAKAKENTTNVYPKSTEDPSYTSDN